MPQVNLPVVPHIWCSPKSIPAKCWHQVYGTCLRRAKGHCINSNLIKMIAKLLGRDVLFVNTNKGHLHWTEVLPEGKFKFTCALSKRYAEMIDRWDETGQQFKMPTECPFGEVVCKGPSETHARSAASNALRVRSTKANLARRALQAPYVS